MNTLAILPALDADRYLVEFPGDGVSVVCTSSGEVLHEIASTDFGKGPAQFRVTLFNAAEGWARDVSLDFLPSDDTPDDEAEYRAARAHKAWERDVTPRRL